MLRAQKRYSRGRQIKMLLDNNPLRMKLSVLSKTTKNLEYSQVKNIFFIISKD